MRFNNKILIVISILFIFSAPYINEISFPSLISDLEFPKASAISGKIHINNNWTETKIAGICSGEGTYQIPYLIKDFRIYSYPESGIKIENSSVYFIIQNCTIVSTHNVAGLDLINVNNSRIYNNTCLYTYYGIRLESCYNNIIDDNDISDDEDSSYSISTGILVVKNSNNNQIINNKINYCGDYGILISDCDANLIQSNRINGVDDNGIYLSRSKNNIVSENSVGNSNDAGIYLFDSDNNQILRNNVYDNDYGIELLKSNDNIIMNNVLSGNQQCIKEEECIGNIYWSNDFCLFIGEPYLGILISTVVIIAIIGSAFFLLRLDHKRAVKRLTQK